MQRVAFLFVISTMAFSQLACAKAEEESGPEQAVRRFLAQMQQLHGEHRLSHEVYESLWRPAREHLRERARRASALSGRAIKPEEMLAPSRFALHFVPERFQVKESGKRAQVVIWGHAGEQAQTRCVFEENDWKIAIEMPPLPPIRARE